MNSHGVSADLINPFVAASFSVLSMVLSEAPSMGSLSAQPHSFTSQQVNVSVGVTGDAVGHIVFGMSLVTADRVASTMIGQPIKSFDQMAASAIGELCNMICGNALLQLSEAGLVCDLAPPTVIRGAKVEISMLAIPAIVVPLVVSQGELQITVGLQSKANQARGAA